MKMKGKKVRRFLGAVLLALTLCSTSVWTQAQQQTKTKAEKPGVTQSTQPGAKENLSFTLRVSKATPRTYTLKATDAKVSDIAKELSRRIEAPVNLSPLMSRQRINLDLGGVNLEAILRMLAPHPYVDYVAWGHDQQPKVLAVYLYAMNENPPALNQTVKSSMEAMLIEGDTEEGTEEYEKRRKEMGEPLKVSYANNRLSVRSQKQPLSIVLAKIANELGVPFELSSDTTEVVDVEFNGYTIEQAMRTLSPSVRLFYRADLLNFESYPIRIALSAPPGGTETTKNTP